MQSSGETRPSEFVVCVWRLPLNQRAPVESMYMMNKDLLVYSTFSAARAFSASGDRGMKGSRHAP